MSAPASALPLRPFTIGHREVLRIAIPMMFAHISTPLVNLVATGVVGQLGDGALIGGVALAAVIFDVLFTTFNFLRGATTGFTAQAYGAGDRRQEQRMLLGGLLTAAVAGLAILMLREPILAAGLAALDARGPVEAAARLYFDGRIWSAPFVLFNFVAFGWIIGRGRAVTAMLLQVLLNGLNLVLSLWWVLGLGGGVTGLAAASVVAEAVTALAGAAVIFAHTDPASWNRPDPASVGRLFTVNRDMMIRSFALLIGLSFFTRQSGVLGLEILAANTILLRFYFIGVAFLDGIATAAEQLAGRAVGARDRRAFDRAIRLTTLWGFAFSASVTLVFFLFGRMVIDLAAPNPGIDALAQDFLPYAVILPLIGTVAFQMDGVYIGATWSRHMRNLMLMSLALYFAASAILQPLFGNHGLWLSLMLFQSARSLVFRFKLPDLAAETFK